LSPPASGPRLLCRSAWPVWLPVVHSGARSRAVRSVGWPRRRTDGPQACPSRASVSSGVVKPRIANGPRERRTSEPTARASAERSPRLTDHSPRPTIAAGRARRGTSGALYPQSATAELNSRSRSAPFAHHHRARR